MRKVDDEQDSAGLNGMFESKSQVLDTSHVPHHHEPSPVNKKQSIMRKSFSSLAEGLEPLESGEPHHTCLLEGASS
jgi:hypothetical protein